jgi:hypothetical protein
MAYIDTPREGKLKEHITTRSNGRVIMHVFALNEEKVSMRCTACSATASWMVNPALTYGVDLEYINDFCEEHLHGSIPLLSGPSIPNETFLTASKLKAAVEKVTGIMGDITVLPPIPGAPAKPVTYTPPVVPEGRKFRNARKDNNDTT